MRTVIVGGGIAGAEALLALRDLAGDRVSLTLVSPSSELVLPALTVAEPFAFGQAERHPLDALLRHVDAELVRGSLAAVDAPQREIRLDDGTTHGFDALVIATGARPVARLEDALTWWPWGDAEAFGGLLRDMEEGYTKRVAFVIPPGAVWPLPLYELALMAARQVWSMGIDDVELTVITPEAMPLALFGRSAAAVVREELDAVGIRLETASVARVQRGESLQVVLQPSARRIDVDRVVALPGVEGPRIPGTTQDDAGFILVGRHGQMRNSESVWAAGDAIAYPVKFGGLASQQADAAAAEIAARIGAQPAPAPLTLKLRGVLMTGSTPRPLGGGSTAAPTDHRPIWRPERKVTGKYLTPFLEGSRPSVDSEDSAGAVTVDEALPSTGSEDAGSFHALWRDHDLQHLGHEMHDYAARHKTTAELLRQHGQLRDE